MAIGFNREVAWGTPQQPGSKYGISFSGTIDVRNQDNVDMTADVNLNCNVSIWNKPYDVLNSFAASDYSALSLGDTDIMNGYPMPVGANYMQNLPFPTNIPQDKVFVEFRGDTFRPTPNRVSLWINGQGVVLNTDQGTGPWNFSFNITKTIKLTGDNSQPVLYWVSSGSDPENTRWINQEKWASLFDFDYRPGANWNGSLWRSHNRTNGACHIYTGSNWKELRTVDGANGAKGNPPLIRTSGSADGWRNQKKLGKE